MNVAILSVCMYVCMHVMDRHPIFARATFNVKYLTTSLPKYTIPHTRRSSHNVEHSPSYKSVYKKVEIKPTVHMYSRP